MPEATNGSEAGSAMATVVIRPTSSNIQADTFSAPDQGGRYCRNGRFTL
jgi:hypothetical protein